MLSNNKDYFTGPFNLTFPFPADTIPAIQKLEQWNMEKTLSNIADKILSLDEASLAGLWKKYKGRMELFDASKEWERSVLIFFIINSVRVKNEIFNEQVMNASSSRQPKERKTHSKDISYLKRVK